MKRKASVAGYFYPGQRENLLEMLSRMIRTGGSRDQAIAVISPHAGYEYSGPVAGALFSSVKIPETCLILGPGHREIAPLFAIQKDGSWLTPLGEAGIASDLAERLMNLCPAVEDDETAHLVEHSLEVQVPFLQYLQNNVSIVPVCISHRAGYDDLAELGKAAALAVHDIGRPVLIVASTDMSHYVSQQTAEKMDFMAIDKILALDPEGLFETVRKEGISMCGFQPTAAALVAAKEMGAGRAELVQYMTSGEQTGDYAQVVGYAGIKIV